MLSKMRGMIQQGQEYFLAFLIGGIKEWRRSRKPSPMLVIIRGISRARLLKDWRAGASGKISCGEGDGGLLADTLGQVVLAGGLGQGLQFPQGLVWLA